MVWDFTFFISITSLKKWYKIVASISFLSTRPNCPVCSSSGTVKNGHIHRGKQRFKCYECGRQFALESRPEGDRPSDQRTNRPIIARTPLSPASPVPSRFRSNGSKIMLTGNTPKYPEPYRCHQKKRKA
jgi:tRNA(Ile2) C34 agmatinyltransferase TiaS